MVAAAADSGADAAVLVVLGVPVTLVATGATGRRTGFDRCPENADIGRGLAGEDAARSVAGISAIEVETNAADQLLHPFLGETGVGAAGAGGGTVEALVDTAHERVAINARRLRMRPDHFLNCHNLSFLRCPPSPARQRNLGVFIFVEVFQSTTGGCASLR